MTARLCALAVAGALLFACSKGGEAPRAGRGGGRGPVSFPVEVVPVAPADVQYAINAVGSIDAFETVQVTARVPGAVERVRFSEGARVKPGQVLAEVEPQRYALAVEAAEAALAKARAAAGDAQAAAGRRERVEKTNPGLIPGEEVAASRTRAQTADAEVAAAEVALAQARLNMRDAHARSPIDGVVETRTVQTGQYVQPGTVLATLVRRDPLLLRFQIPAGDAGRVKEGMQAQFRIRGQDEQLAARITHVAQAADPRSRMVAVTGEVDRAARDRLRPGAFAEVTIALGNTNRTPAIPETAIRPSDRGFLAYVVDGKVARERVLELGLRTADGRVEVKSGLALGERLVIRGAEPLRDGAPVQVDQPAAPKPAPDKPQPAARGNLAP